ncbi:MAG: T9SS type A sorting domain-containing protein [Prevotellaceae bacterium]|nr:T9SS type A sorting domain-containing protein [Candidatus Minthosoma caballi]
MKKSLHINILMILFAACFAMPVAMNAQDIQRNQVEMEQNQINVIANESNLRVKNADGLVIEIYSLTGEKVYTQRIEGQSKSIDLAHLQKGYYIVKIGKFTRKVYLR